MKKPAPEPTAETNELDEPVIENLEANSESSIPTASSKVAMADSVAVEVRKLTERLMAQTQELKEQAFDNQLAQSIAVLRDRPIPSRQLLRLP
ncbi:MAG: hypothetical protein H0W86_07755 [Armatimonadetes bacterium]|nr:hypothetical protein [Armatimonadota bacterium]